MTIRTESRITIAGSVGEVWAYLCDVARWPEWAPTVLDCRIRGGGTLRPGAWVEQRARDLGWNHRRSEQVTAVDSPTSMAFTGTMGTSVARWGMHFRPEADGRTHAMMWVEVDVANIMRAIPGRAWAAQVQRVSDIEMAAMKAAVESDVRAGEGVTVSQADRTRERLIEVYRKSAKHYDATSRLFPAPGYPQRAQRLRAVRALGLHKGDTVVDVACGTGLNFPLLEEAIGPGGRIVGVDLTDAMLERAAQRSKAKGWSNVSLVQGDAVEFGFPVGVDAILCTYALTQVPDGERIIVHGAAALSDGGRWAVLDLKIPDGTPAWLLRLGVAMVRTSASLDEWIVRRPWQTIRETMQKNLADASWAELCFGTAFLAAGTRAGRTDSERGGPGPAGR